MITLSGILKTIVLAIFTVWLLQVLNNPGLSVIAKMAFSLGYLVAIFFLLVNEDER